MTDEELVEEIMWIAFEKDFEFELIELATRYMTKDKLSRLESYKKALNELLIK